MSEIWAMSINWESFQNEKYSRNTRGRLDNIFNLNWSILKIHSKYEKQQQQWSVGVEDHSLNPL